MTSMVKRIQQVCTPRLGTIHSASPGFSPVLVSRPTARVARVSATATLSATTVPVFRFFAISAITNLVVDTLFCVFDEREEDRDEPDRGRSDGHDPDCRKDAEHQRKHHFHAGLG